MDGDIFKCCDRPAGVGRDMAVQGVLRLLEGRSDWLSANRGNRLANSRGFLDGTSFGDRSSFLMLGRQPSRLSPSRA